MGDTIVFYHGNCNDGFAAATVAYQKFGDKAEYIPVFYGQQDQFEVDQCLNKQVFILDFCFNPEITERICQIADRVTTLDHHERRFKEIQQSGIFEKYPQHEFVFNNNYCGAVLSWLYFNDYKKPDEEMPYFLKLIQDRDLWQKKEKLTNDLYYYLVNNEKDFAEWSKLFSNPELLVDKCRQGSFVHEFVEKFEDQLVEHSFIDPIFGCPVVNLSGLPVASSVAEKLHKKYDSSFAGVFIQHEKGRSYSLRSPENGKDVSEISALFGGGGHKHAAGCFVNSQTLSSKYTMVCFEGLKDGRAFLTT